MGWGGETGLGPNNAPRPAPPAPSEGIMKCQGPTGPSQWSLGSGQTCGQFASPQISPTLGDSDSVGRGVGEEGRIWASEFLAGSPGDFKNTTVGEQLILFGS